MQQSANSTVPGFSVEDGYERRRRSTEVEERRAWNVDTGICTSAFGYKRKDWWRWSKLIGEGIPLVYLLLSVRERHTHTHIWLKVQLILIESGLLRRRIETDRLKCSVFEAILFTVLGRLGPCPLQACYIGHCVNKCPTHTQTHIHTTSTGICICVHLCLCIIKQYQHLYTYTVQHKPTPIKSLTNVQECTQHSHTAFSYHTRTHSVFLWWIMLLCIWWDAPLSPGWVECRDIVLKLPNKHTYTLKHIHTHSQRLSVLSPGDTFPFLDQEQEHFPPLLPLLYECRKAPPLLKKNKTTKQSPSCTSPSHAHIHTLQANIPSFAQIYHT